LAKEVGFSPTNPVHASGAALIGACINSLFVEILPASL
jgi:hypothetical protein